MNYRTLTSAMTAPILGGLTLAAMALAVALPAFADASTVMRWGSFGTPPGALTPTMVEGLSNVTAIDASNASAYALESNGSVWAWGNNRAGQLGNENPEGSQDKAVQVPLSLPAGVTITSIGEAEFVGVAIASNGHAWVWGEGGPAACLEDGGYFIPPTEVPGISNAVAVQGGGHHTLWLLSNGTVEACGSNAQGQLGVSGIAASDEPVPVPGLSDVVEISAAERTSCARTASGAVYDWGANWDGQIGNGEISEEGVSVPYRVPLPGPATEVSCGGNVPTNDYTLALVGGQVYGWGADGAGQIGDVATADKPSPVATGLYFSKVVASGGTSYGVDKSGDAWAWGSAFENALGDGKTPRNAPVPVLVDEGVQAISATAHDVADLH